MMKQKRKSWRRNLRRKNISMSQQLVPKSIQQIHRTLRLHNIRNWKVQNILRFLLLGVVPIRRWRFRFLNRIFQRHLHLHLRPFSFLNDQMVNIFFLSSWKKTQLLVLISMIFKLLNCLKFNNNYKQIHRRQPINEFLLYLTFLLKNNFDRYHRWFDWDIDDKHLILLFIKGKNRWWIVN